MTADLPPQLFRAPAAVISGAYVVGLVIGESARPLSAEPLSLAFYGATALVLLPFVLPTRWFAAVPRALHAWMVGGAIVASVRAAFMAGWLFPRLPLSSWLTKLALDAVLVAALWIASIANRQSPIPIGNRESSLPIGNHQPPIGNRQAQ